MTRRRRTPTVWLLTTIFILAGGARAIGQRLAIDAGDVTATRQILALTYPEGLTSSIRLSGTTRLPGATGEAKVQRKRGMTEIEIEVDEMKPAAFFGGDYTTYVLWVVSPEGYVDNVGEFVLQGNRAKLDVSTPLETFGMFVAAEPHFLVSRPSRFVVMENTQPTVRLGGLKVSTLTYRGFDGVYQFTAESLANMRETKGETRAHVASARVAVDLAARAGAAVYAPDELARARTALGSAEAGLASGASVSNQMLLAHEVIRLAATAQQLSEEGAFQAALAQERQENATEIGRLANALGTAETNAERARIEAQRQALDARMEARARHAAQLRADEQARRADEATRRAAVAEREHQDASTRLRIALERITQVTESTRGLVVNIPNVLFDFNKATLRPEGREVLAKISGVLQVLSTYGAKVRRY